MGQSHAKFQVPVAVSYPLPTMKIDIQCTKRNMSCDTYAAKPCNIIQQNYKRQQNYVKIILQILSYSIYTTWVRDHQPSHFVWSTCIRPRPKTFFPSHCVGSQILGSPQSVDSQGRMEMLRPCGQGDTLHCFIMILHVNWLSTTNNV